MKGSLKLNYSLIGSAVTVTTFYGWRCTTR
jgi:hypothetical protein